MQTQYPDWKAPQEDSQFIIWPEPGRVLEQTRGNHASLTQSDVRIQNLPLHELREAQRQCLGHPDEQFLICSGHQTELFHAGVWVKDVLCNAVAEQLDGAAWHFAVDTDHPKHLQLRWPSLDGRVESIPIIDDPNASHAQWAAQLNSPTPAHLATIAEALSRSRFTFEPLLGPFLESMRRQSLDSPSLAASLTNATHELSWSLGLRHHAALCSPVWDCEPYLAFVYHILAHATRFADDYNNALANYRRENKIRSGTRPMPDLHLTPTSCEVPFWLDDLRAGTRSRAQVWMDKDYHAIVAPGGDELRLDASHDGWEAARELSAFLRRNQLRLSPRALTLTMALRLLVADNFVHGIGGARYDQVTDHLVQSHFGIAPPAFAVTTATLYFPDAANRTRACLPCVVTEGHHLRHSLLGDRKRELVAAIDSAPRCSSKRRELFGQMHRELTAASVNHPKLAQWQDRLHETEQRAAEEQILFDRELFFALQSRERLQSLIDAYRARFA